jgi:hypothetical protein
MTYKKDSEIYTAGTTTPVLTDAVRGLDDPGGTPITAMFLLSALRTLIGENLDGVKINDSADDHQYVLAASDLAANRTITLPLLAGNDVFVFADFVQTLTNKRITQRITTEASSATPTINTDNTDIHEITALAEAITSMTTNLSGTPTNNQKLLVKILDNGTSRAIAGGASNASTSSGTLPTATTINKWSLVALLYSTSRSKWFCVGVTTEV